MTSSESVTSQHRIERLHAQVKPFWHPRRNVFEHLPNCVNNASRLRRLHKDSLPSHLMVKLSMLAADEGLLPHRRLGKCRVHLTIVAVQAREGLLHRRSSSLPTADCSRVSRCPVMGTA